MNAARPGCSYTNSESVRVLCVAASHKGRSFFMAGLNEANLVLVRPKRFHNAVDTVARNPEHLLDAPIDQSLDQNIGSGLFGHEQNPRNGNRSQKNLVAILVLRIKS